MPRSPHLLLLALPCAGAALAQPPAPRVPDTIAQRVVACTPCHGREGRATSHGYFPRIAGKPEGYLYNQLVNFREGRRSNEAMAYLVAHLSNDYLREMAAHFAALDLPYPPPQSTGAPAAVLARGGELVRKGDAARRIPSCASCHGEALAGAQPAIPGLLGLSHDYILGQFAFWKGGQRRAPAPDCMAEIVARMDADDLRATATWLAAQPVPAGAKPAAKAALPLPLDCGSGLE